MARSLFVALTLLSLLALSHAASVSSSSTRRSLKILLRQPTNPASATPAPAANPVSTLTNAATSAVNNVVAAFKGIFGPIAAQLKDVLSGLKLGKPDNKPKGDTSAQAQLAATNVKGLDTDASKGLQYFQALAAKITSGEAATYVQNALNNLKSGGPKAGNEQAAPKTANSPNGKSAAPGAPAPPATPTPTPAPGAPRSAPSPSPSRPAPSVIAAPPSPTAPASTLTALVEEGVEQAIEEYHVVFRAFIPGAGTTAIAGVNTKSMTVGTPATFPGYRAGPATHSFAGYVIGIYETDEIFNTNHRDWSLDIKGNDESKTFVYLQMKKEGGVWKKTSVSNGSSRTEHYCNGIWASWLQFWPTGLCCNDKLTWKAEEGLTGFAGTANKATFKIGVRKGNPCVPGSHIAGPIMHSFDVEVDFATNKFTYSGKKSQFPALEVCHGTNPRGFRCHQYGVAGKSVFDLMGFQQNVAKQTMDLFVS